MAQTNKQTLEVVQRALSCGALRSSPRPEMLVEPDPQPGPSYLARVVLIAAALLFLLLPLLAVFASEPQPQRDCLLIFRAKWCQPCVRMDDELAALKRAGWQILDADKWTAPKDGSVPVVLVDVDRSPSLAWLNRVDTLPCLVRIRDGVEVRRHAGYANSRQIAEVFTGEK